MHNKYGFKIGDTVILDASHPNGNEVIILAFTPNEMFSTVRSVNSTMADFWETMTNRLTPIKY